MSVCHQLYIYLYREPQQVNELFSQTVSDKTYIVIGHKEYSIISGQSRRLALSTSVRKGQEWGKKKQLRFVFLRRNETAQSCVFSKITCQISYRFPIFDLPKVCIDILIMVDRRVVFLFVLRIFVRGWLFV